MSFTDIISHFTDIFHHPARFAFRKLYHYLLLDNNNLKTMDIGETKRIVLSKDFKGGKVRNLFGSTHLDFTQAGLNGIAILDISQTFGETTISVPADWRVEPDLFHFCSVVEDDRSYVNRANNSDKVLVIKGTSVFAVVDVLN
jgi:predicted membrane protein